MFEPIDLIAAAIKAIGLLAVLQAAGVAVFVALYGSHCGSSLPRIRSVGFWSSVAATMCVLIAQSLEAGRMAGEFAGVFDPSLQLLNWCSDAASASLVRVLGCILICVGLRASVSLELVGALVVVASFAMTGHTASHDYRYVLATLLTSHVAIAAFWIGALPALMGVVKRETSLQAIESFSRHALWCVPALALAGVSMAWVLLPNLAALGTSYGFALLAKVGGYAALLALAAFNKLRLTPRMQRGDQQARRVFIRSVAIEYGVIALVICATASMTTIFPLE
jgi:putative copper resistance protein D